MELTPEERQVFAGLADTSTGRVLVKYLDRLCDKLCDIRTMEGVSEPTRQGRLDAAEILSKHLIGLLSLKAKKDKTNKEYV